MAIVLSEPLDGGSIDLASSSVDDGAGLITVQPRFTFNSRWWWTCFHMVGVDGLTPTVDLLATNLFNNTASANLNARHGAWAYDPDGPWFDWTSVTQQSSPYRIRLANAAPFDQDAVYYAYYPMYTWARVEADVLGWAMSEYVRPASGSAADLSFDTLPSISNGQGRNCPDAKLYAFEVSDWSVSAAKNLGAVTSGNHPGETPGHYAFAAFVDFLLSDDLRAAFIRKHWRIVVYPEINPQGRYGGLFRSAPDAPTSDFNRIWEDPGTSDTCDTLKASFQNLLPGVNFFADFHCYNFDYGQSSNYRDATVGDEKNNEGWTDLYREFETPHALMVFGPEVSGNLRGHIVGSSGLDVGDSLKAVLGIEIGSSRNYGIAEYERCGRRVAYNLAYATERGFFPVAGRDLGGRRYFR